MKEYLIILKLKSSQDAVVIEKTIEKYLSENLNEWDDVEVVKIEECNE